MNNRIIDKLANAVRTTPRHLPTARSSRGSYRWNAAAAPLPVAWLVSLSALMLLGIPAPADEKGRSAASREAGQEASPALHPLLAAFDVDGDQRLSSAEAPAALRRRMQRFDDNRDRYLDAAELAALPGRGVQRLLGERTGTEAGSSAAMKPESPKHKPGEVYAPAAREEFDPPSLIVGDPAPDFTLPRADGGGEVTLSALRGKKPVVLVFGSITCAPFRQRVADIPAVHEKYAGEAEFFMIYIREAHPESIVEVNDEDGGKMLKKFTQTDDFDLRLENARYCTGLIEMPFPTLVDGLDNRVKESYAGWPIRLVVVDREGKIAYDGGRGPRGFEPDKLEQWLAANLR